MLHTLLLMCCFSSIVNSLTERELSMIKADLEREVAKMGTTKQEDIVQTILNSMKKEDKKSESLENGQDEQLYKMLLENTRPLHQDQSSQKKVESTRKLEDSLDKDVTKELLDALIRNIQRNNNKRDAREQLVDALVRNRNIIEKTDKTKRKDESVLDLHKLLEKKSDAKEGGMSIKEIDIGPRGRYGRKDELSNTGVQGQTDDDIALSILKDLTKKDAKRFDMDGAKRSEVSTRHFDTAENLLQSLIKDELETRLTAALKDSRTQKEGEEAKDTNEILRSLIKEVELKKKEAENKLETKTGTDNVVVASVIKDDNVKKSETSKKESDTADNVKKSETSKKESDTAANEKKSETSKKESDTTHNAKKSEPSKKESDTPAKAKKSEMSKKESNIAANAKKSETSKKQSDTTGNAKKSETSTKVSDMSKHDILISLIKEEMEKRLSNADDTNEILKSLMKEVDVKKEADVETTNVVKDVDGTNTNEKKGTVGRHTDNHHLFHHHYHHGDGCVDELSYCEELKHMGYCGGLHNLMEKCRRTCGFCKPCQGDIWKTTTCQRVQAIGYCSNMSYQKRLEKYCHRTCGYCRVPSPPACMNDALGCCWDNSTFVKNGCPACEDSRVLKNVVCERFKSACGNAGEPGAWMKLHCPETCQLCKVNEDGIRKLHSLPCDDKTRACTCRDCTEFPKFAKRYCCKTCTECKKPQLLRKLVV